MKTKIDNVVSFLVDSEIYKLLSNNQEAKKAFFIVNNFYFSYLLSKDLELEVFVTKFNKLKKLTKNEPRRIDLIARNETKFENRQLILDLMLNGLILKRLLSQSKQKLLNSPDNFSRLWNEFNKYYKNDLYKTGKKILKTQLQIINNVLREHDLVFPVEEDLLNIFNSDEIPNYSYLDWIRYALEDLIGAYNGAEDEDSLEVKMIYQKALKGLDFLENNILKFDLENIYMRWHAVPAVLVPKSIAVKNPLILYDLYREVVSNYVLGNYLSCISMCRSLFEHILVRYYYDMQKDKDTDLSQIISYCSFKYDVIKSKNLHKLRLRANKIIHNYNGENIDDSIIFDFIRTVKYLIENIPSNVPLTFFPNYLIYVRECGKEV